MPELRVGEVVSLFGERVIFFPRMQLFSKRCLDCIGRGLKQSQVVVH